MKRKLYLFFVSAAIVSMLLPILATAHSGKTDSSGGHYDRSTGEYHFHHGYAAHAHSDMDGDGDIDCPYKFKNNESPQYGVSTTNSNNLQGAKKSEYDKGYSAGVFDGLADGRMQGYDIGRAAAEKESEEILADSVRRAYAKSAIIGLLSILLVYFLTASTTKSKEEKLRREVNALKIKLKQVPEDRESLRYAPLPNKYASVLAAISKKSGKPVEDIIERIYISVSKALGQTEAEATAELQKILYPEQTNTKTELTVGPAPNTGIKEMRFFENTLVVTFGNGKVFEYVDVPDDKGNSLINAYNPVQFFYNNIDGHYVYKLVRERSETFL